MEELADEYMPFEKHETLDPFIAELKAVFFEEYMKVLPMSHQVLRNHFSQFKIETFPILFDKLGDQANSSEMINSIIDKQVLEVAEAENFYRIEEIALKNLKAFVQKFSLDTEVDPTVLFEYLEENIQPTDNVLDDIITKQIGSKKKTVKDLDEISRVVETCSVVLVQYQKALCNKYQVPAYYVFKKNEGHSELLERFKKSFPTYHNFLYGIFEKQYALVAESLRGSTDSKQETRLNLNARLKEYSDFKSKASQLFINNVEKELNFPLSQIFYYEYLQKFETEAASLSEALYRFHHDTSTIDSFTKLFDLYYRQKGIDLFGSLFDTKELIVIWKILQLTDYDVKDDELWTKHCQKKLQDLGNNYILPKLSSEARSEVDSLTTIIDHINLKGDKRLLLELLHDGLTSWDALMKATKGEIFFRTLFSVFIYFSNSVRGEKNQCYRSYYRRMIVRAFRNFSNGEQINSNYQILLILEQLAMHYLTLENSEPIDEDQRQALLKQLASDAAIKRRGIKPENLILPNADKIDKQLEKPEQFYIERISKDPNVRSKHIILVCSGWKSEHKNKSEYWQDLVATYPMSEIHAIHYRSQTKGRVLGTFLKEFGRPFASLMLGKFAKAKEKFQNAPKQCIEETFIKAYKAAVKTGIYLANLIASSEVYENRTVSLVGFSLGTKVMAACLAELERLKVYDKVYEVLLMGGVVHRGDLKESSLRMIAHELINCYTKKDKVLKMALPRAELKADPIGLDDIKSKAKNVKNADCTDFIGRHGMFRRSIQNITKKFGFNEDINYLLN